MQLGKNGLIGEVEMYKCFISERETPAPRLLLNIGFQFLHHCLFPQQPMVGVVCVCVCVCDQIHRLHLYINTHNVSQ